MRNYDGADGASAAMKIPIYINNFNRLKPVVALLKDIARFPEVGRVRVVDNLSTYPPLLDWYSTDCPVEIVQLGRNAGVRGVWSALDHTEKYWIAADPDIDLSLCPDDLIARMASALDKYSDIRKIMPSIKLDDVPREFPWYDQLISTEAQYRQKKRDNFWWEADVDTIFAMFRSGEPFAYRPALRTPAPYELRHLSNYYVPGKLTEEEIYYIKSVAPEHKPGIYWSTLYQDNQHLLGI